MDCCGFSNKICVMTVCLINPTGPLPYAISGHLVVQTAKTKLSPI